MDTSKLFEYLEKHDLFSAEFDTFVNQQKRETLIDWLIDVSALSQSRKTNVQKRNIQLLCKKLALVASVKG